MPNVIFVRDKNESIKVQMALFSVGIFWYLDNNEPKYLDDHFLYSTGKFLTGSCNDFEVAVGWSSVDCKPLDGKNVIENPMMVEGAKQPEKMITVGGKEFSESTILKALQQYVGG